MLNFIKGIYGLLIKPIVSTVGAIIGLLLMLGVLGAFFGVIQGTFEGCNGEIADPIFEAPVDFIVPTHDLFYKWTFSFFYKNDLCYAPSRAVKSLDEDGFERCWDEKDGWVRCNKTIDCDQGGWCDY